MQSVAGKRRKKGPTGGLVETRPLRRRPGVIVTSDRLRRLADQPGRTLPAPSRPVASKARPPRRPAALGGLGGSPRIAGGFVPVRGRDHPMVDRERSGGRRVPR